MLLSADLESFIDYFKRFTENHADLRYFLYGGVELGIQYATGADNFDYPFAWLEQPLILTDDNDMGQLMEVYYGAISIIYAPALDSLEEQIRAEINSVRICYDLQKQMKKDNREKGFISCELKEMKKDAVDRGWANNHHGWRLQFELHMNANGLLS